MELSEEVSILNRGRKDWLGLKKERKAGVLPPAALFCVEIVTTNGANL